MRRQPWSVMRRKLLSVLGVMCATLLFASPAPAQSAPAQSPAGFAGEWTLAFAVESRSGEPNLKPTPWMTFTATVVQVDSALGGSMRSDGPSGQFGCKLRAGGCTAGRMRLSWDEQDWQLFEFALDAGSTTKGKGKAEIRFPDGSVHRYSFVLAKR
jgi:hypothetical protein